MNVSKTMILFVLMAATLAMTGCNTKEGREHQQQLEEIRQQGLMKREKLRLQNELAIAIEQSNIEARASIQREEIKQVHKTERDKFIKPIMFMFFTITVLGTLVAFVQNRRDVMKKELYDNLIDQLPNLSPEAQKQAIISLGGGGNNQRLLS